MAKKLALVFGVVLVLAGILGYVPNPLIGSGAFFDTNHAHDLLHLVLGVILLIVAFAAPAASRLWVNIVGVVTALAGLIGFAMIPLGGMLLGVFETNMADHWLHLVLGVLMVFLAWWMCKSKKMGMPAAMPPAGGMPPASM